MRFVGFTFKKVDDDSKFKNIVSMFDEIEQERDKQKTKKVNLQLDDIDPKEDRKVDWIHKIPGNFAITPKSTHEPIQPTLMVSPRKETKVKLPASLKVVQSAQDKRYTIATQPVKVQASETTKKPKEGSDTGRMLYMGNYKKGNLGFNRSSSNEPGNATRLKNSIKDEMGSPKKPYVANIGDTLSSRKTPRLSDTRKPDLLAHNLMMSPSSQGASKKKGFGFLGLKFLNRNKT